MPLRGYLVLLTASAVPASVSALTIWGGHCLPANGWALVVADTTPAQHTSLVADTLNVTYLPFEDTLGALVPFSGTLADVSAANRTTLTTILEGKHVPLDGLTGSHTVRQVLIRVIRRLVCRQLLGANDWTEGLDTLVSAMSAVKRQAIRDTLESHGYDLAGVQGTDTIREAIRKVAGQAIRMSRTGADS